MTDITRSARLYLTDRDSNSAFYTLRLSLMTSTAETLESVLTLLVPATQDIADAIISRVAILYGERIDPDEEPGENKNAHTVIVFWRNVSDELASIIIPALSSDIPYTNNGSYGVIADLSVFDELTLALSGLGAMDQEGIAINGSVVAAALIV